MVEQARSKLRAEMEADRNPYIHVVGNFLLTHMESHPESADNILATGKTIIKSLTHMEAEARKKKVGRSAVLTDEEGFAAVLKYFGIDGAPAEIRPPVPDPVPAMKPAASFDVSLDDLLGE